MNHSSSSNFLSGFSNSTPNSPKDVSFNATAGNRSSVKGGPAKPRMAKVRRQETRAAAPGFVPFGPGLARAKSGDEFVFGASKSSIGKGGVEGMDSLNLNRSDASGFVFGDNVNKNGSSSSSLDEDMKKGVCGRREFSSGNDDTTVESILPDELKKKSNIEGSSGGDSVRKFGFGSVENVLPDQIKNLSIKDPVNSGNVFKENAGEMGQKMPSEMGQKLNDGSVMNKSSGQTVPMESIFKGVMHGIDVNGNHIRRDRPDVGAQPSGIAGSSPFSSSGFSGVNVLGVPPTGKLNNSEGFNFTSKNDGVGLPFVEFRTPNTKGSLFTGLNPKVEFGAKLKDPKSKKKRGKLKQPTTVHLWSGQEFVPRESGFQETPQASGSYSPMGVSPHQEMLAETRASRETSVASEESFTLDNQYETTDSLPTVMNDAIDEDLVVAVQQMNIAKERANHNEMKEEDSEHCFGTGGDDLPEECISGAETESFRSANEEIDFINDTAVTSSENEASSSTSICKQDNYMRTQFSPPACSQNIDIPVFTFSASSSPQSSPNPHPKKKDGDNVGHDKCSPNAKGQHPFSSLQFSPFSRAPLPMSPTRSKKASLSASCVVGDNSEMLRGQDIKQEPGLTSAASVAAQEACEKWRLRGNQAYTTGDLCKAEDCYTQGLSCISKGESSRSCLRALMLCYSNRAATRMSLGRMRDALEDCKMAGAIDPNFLKVQVRAAGCYLSLGGVEDASQYFKKCLQLGSDVCVDRKIAVEASEGLQKAQKVSEYMQLSTKLLENRRRGDAESALETIADALIISPLSEKLLEMKAEFLFMLRRYEEVIQMCEQTFDCARKNAPPLQSDHQLPSAGDLELVKDPSFRIWRCRLTFNSYFYVGKLEEAIGSLDKLQELGPVISSSMNDSRTMESSIPLASTVRELLRLKTAGNEAFQASRHSEAIEHYTAALLHNIESRPFSAICFCNRAAAYKALGQITDAIADCSLAIALDGNYLKAISRRATLYEMIRDYAQAADDLQKLISICTDQIEGRTNQFGPSDKSTSFANDIRQARLRLPTVAEEARKDIPLNMYLILGVEPSASSSEIKKAYRKAALRHHPDKACQFLARSDNGDDGPLKEIKDADRLFKMIGEAYAVLSDPIKRAEYDSEEESRKQRTGSGTYRTYTEAQNYTFQRNGSRSQWREAWRTHGK